MHKLPIILTKKDEEEGKKKILEMKKKFRCLTYRVKFISFKKARE